MVIIIIMMMITIILVLTLNGDDDRNKQHILGIGRYHQFLYENSADRICVPNAYICWTPSIPLFIHHHLQ